MHTAATATMMHSISSGSTQPGSFVASSPATRMALPDPAESEGMAPDTTRTQAAPFADGSAVSPDLSKDPRDPQDAVAKLPPQPSHSPPRMGLALDSPAANGHQLCNDERAFDTLAMPADDCTVPTHECPTRGPEAPSLVTFESVVPTPGIGGMNVSLADDSSGDTPPLPPVAEQPELSSSVLPGALAFAPESSAAKPPESSTAKASRGRSSSLRHGAGVSLRQTR